MSRELITARSNICHKQSCSLADCTMKRLRYASRSLSNKQRSGIRCTRKLIGPRSSIISQRISHCQIQFDGHAAFETEWAFLELAENINAPLHGPRLI